MSINYSIKVVDDDGDAISGARVTVHYFGMLSGWDEDLTDENGWVYFETNNPAISFVSINGETVSGEFGVEDGETYSLTAP